MGVLDLVCLFVSCAVSGVVDPTATWRIEKDALPWDLTFAVKNRRKKVG